MSVKLSPVFIDTQFTSSGALANGYLVWTYAAGSSTPQTTYTDSTGATPQANPIVYNARGEPANPIWLTTGLFYKFVLETAPPTGSPPGTHGNLVRTIDNVSGVNDATISQDQWLPGPTPTYVSATQFTLVGDQTSTFAVGRKLKFTTTAGTVYGTITVSAFTTLTTITVVMDGVQVLDSGLSAVSYGILSSVNLSIPRFIQAGTGITVTYDTSGRPVITSTAVAQTIVKGIISGLTLSAAGGTATMGIAAGQATDSTTTDYMTLASAYTKLGTAWAVGSAAGGKAETGAIAATTQYHWYEIKRPDTGVVDICFSTSATGLVAGSYVSGGGNVANAYTLFRRIGSIKTDGSAQWVAFTQNGNRFRLATPVLNINNAAVSAYANQVVSSPTGVQCLAFGSVNSGSGGSIVNIRPVGASDALPLFTASPLGYGGGAANASYWQEYTDTSAQISIGGNSGSATVGTYLTTAGWFDNRGTDL